MGLARIRVLISGFCSSLLRKGVSLFFVSLLNLHLILIVAEPC